MRRKSFWSVVALIVGLAPAAAYAAAPGFGSGGGGSGGVIDNQVLALFEFGVDGGVLNLERLAWWAPVDSEEEADDSNLICIYSGNTAESQGLSYVDLGRSLVIRVEAAKASCGTISAEIEVFYRDNALDTSPIIDQECDGNIRRGVLRSSDSAVASVHIETDAGPVIDAVGEVGSAAYSIEQFVCVDTSPAP